jgi:hypothetical protein
MRNPEDNTAGRLASNMARELVTEQGIGESAEAIWRRLQTEHGRVVSAPSIIPAAVDIDATLPPPAILPLPARVSALKFGIRPPLSPSRRQEGTSPPAEHKQFSLF